jgi:hypothetical protein
MLQAIAMSLIARASHSEAATDQIALSPFIIRL